MYRISLRARFIGSYTFLAHYRMINYYRDMWIRRSDILAPLAKLTSKEAKWKWKKEHQNAFDTIKRIVSQEVLLCHPNFNKPFEVHTAASKNQLGAIISQEGHLIALYSKKLNSSQSNYKTTESHCKNP